MNARWTMANQIVVRSIATGTSPATNESLDGLAIVKLADHGVVEMDREGFVEVVEVDPSSYIYVSLCCQKAELQKERAKRRPTRVATATATFLWLALLTKVPQLQQCLPYSFFANCTI